MEIVLYIWLLTAAYLIGHHLFFHLRLLFHKASTKPNDFNHAVSVVICARDEAENLAKNLPIVLRQDYSDYEVFVVNDRSKDNTEQVLIKLQEQFSHLKVLTVREDNTYVGKKKALTLGIKNAKHDYLLLTDADCQIASSNWVKSMSGGFIHRDIVLGFGGYVKTQGFTSKLVRWETLQAAMQYFSFAQAGMPYMGVGRNLAYRKDLFDSSGGFESHIGLPSGDDDLFISENGEYNNVSFNWDDQAFTYSDGPKNLKTWWRQKRRHMSTSSYYRFWPKTFLTNYGTAQLGFYLLLPLVLIMFPQSSILWFGLILRFLIHLVVLIPISKRFKSFDIVWLHPIWEAWVTILITIVLLQNKFFGKPKAWT